jgi:N-acetylmuramoyl-L-alanine amidase
MLANYRRSAGFAVLKVPDVPTILLEMGYVPSKQDQKLLTSVKFQKRLAVSNYARDYGVLRLLSTW